MNRFQALIDQPICIKGRFSMGDLLDATAILTNTEPIYIRHGGCTVRARDLDQRRMESGDSPLCLVLGPELPSSGRPGGSIFLVHIRHIQSLGPHASVCILPVECPGRGALYATGCSIDRKGRLVVS